jgi:hypothetical protein
MVPLIGLCGEGNASTERTGLIWFFRLRDPLSALAGFAASPCPFSTLLSLTSASGDGWAPALLLRNAFILSAA